MFRKKLYYKKHKGIALVVAMLFVMVFSALSVAMFSMSSASAQTSNNHRQSNHAMNAALSGLECAKYVVANIETFETGVNTVSDSDADTIWQNLCSKLQTQQLGGLSVASESQFSDGNGSGDEIQTPLIPYGDSGAKFLVRFYRYTDAGIPRTIYIQSSGEDGEITRNVGINLVVTKDAEVLNYAIAGRGRMWITGDSTIDGDIYSSWDRADISPFNLTDDSAVLGTVNTVLDQDTVDDASWQLEELDGNDNAMFDYGIDVYDINGDPVTDSYGTVDDDGYLVDTAGNPVFDVDGELVPVDYNNRIYDGDDELQGYHEGVNYGQLDQDEIPGMSIDDYDTDMYKDIVMGVGGSGNIAASGTIEVEYFPHSADSYNQPKYSSSRTLNRHVYENMTFTNARLPDDRNALFRNCTFEEVLYVDCYKSTSYHYNNVRFEDCNFNGVIVTDTPSTVKWKNNALYFTGSANFNNTSSIQEATILAPHFNVDLGDANNEGVPQDDENVITGAVVGGIVDVRGNARIEGTIISMFDTTNYSSGFVTNIGATLGDGGSETTSIEDVGTIEITPDKGKMLPSGINSPIVLKPVSGTYHETF